MRANQLVTLESWRRAGTFERAAHPGDRVSEDVVDAFVSALPPVTLTDALVQCGDPHSYEFDDKEGRWRETFTTFCKTEEGWQYRGHCFAGKNTEPQER